MTALAPVRSTVTVYLDPELDRALRLKAAHSRVSMSEIVNETLRADREDLAAARSRARETSVDYETFLAKLEADGTL